MSNVKLKYTPHPQQRMVHEDNHRFKVIVCGRRFGKTTLAINEMIRKAAQFSGDYWYISPTYKMSKSIAWDMLKVYTPDILKRKVNESELLLEMINGSRIWLKGADDEDKLRGVGLDGVLLDEFADMKSSVWSAVVRPMLMDRKGWAIFLGTPKGQNHFYEHFIRDPKTHDEEYRDIDDLPIATDEDYKSWKFKTSDNPFISRSEIEKLRRELPEETYNQEVEASFENFTGLVYKEYNRMQKELTLDTIELQPWWDVYIGIDTGKYTGVVFMAIDDEGNEYIFDEIFDVGGLCSDISTQIKHKMANRKVKGMVIDSASQVKREYTAHGLYFQDSQKDILSSIQMTRRKHRDKTLYITKDCRALIRELKSRRWEEKSAVTKPVKEDDHLCFDGETMIMCDNVETY